MLARLRQRGRVFAVLLLIAVLALREYDPPVLQVMRMRSFDVVHAFFPREHGDEQQVVVVDIDDESLQTIGQWPWPRTILADLVARLSSMRAAVIGFDVIFAEPDRMSPRAIAASADGWLDPTAREALARLPSNDQRLAEALATSRRVVIGEAARDRGASDTGPRLKNPVARLGADPRPYLLHFPGLVRAIPELEEAAAGRGMVTTRPELDGIVRRIPLVLTIGSEIFPALTFEMLRIATGESIVVHTASAGVAELRVGRYNIPTDQRGRVWINFARYDRKYYISAKDILARAVDPVRIRGKFVLVGTSATGLGDLKATPLEGAVPGVDLHAQLLETVLNGTYRIHPDWASGAEIVLIGIMGLMMIIFVPIAGARATLLILVTVGGMIAAGTIYLFVGQSIFLDGSLPLLTASLLYVSLVYGNYRAEENQREQIRGAFGRYLSPALVEQLARDPSRLKAGGEARTMTFLFCDIRNFTTLAEQFRQDPASLTRLINRFMTPMTNRILVRRGTIDKYMGDCIMAFWNAPLPDRRHARNACKAALDILHELKKLNAAFDAEATDSSIAYKLKVGVGINTGECVVGNLGSDLRFDYSVLGDAVNLASRLEGQSKFYGVAIVIGEATQVHVDDYATIELDLIAVRGKREATRIFALLGRDDVANRTEFKELAQLHRDMITAYREREWAVARRIVHRCRSLQIVRAFDLTALYDLYDLRIADFEINPPPADWAGTHIAESK